MNLMLGSPQMNCLGTYYKSLSHSFFKVVVYVGHPMLHCLVQHLNDSGALSPQNYIHMFLDVLVHGCIPLTLNPTHPTPYIR